MSAYLHEIVGYGGTVSIGEDTMACGVKKNSKTAEALPVEMEVYGFRSADDTLMNMGKMYVSEETLKSPGWEALEEIRDRQAGGNADVINWLESQKKASLPQPELEK